MGLMWGVPAWKVLHMHGTVPSEHPWEVMPDLCFCRDPGETEQEDQATAEKAVTKEGFQGTRTTPALGLTAVHPEVADWSDGKLVPSEPTQQLPTGDRSIPACHRGLACDSQCSGHWMGSRVLSSSSTNS